MQKDLVDHRKITRLEWIDQNLQAIKDILAECIHDKESFAQALNDADITTVTGKIFTPRTAGDYFRSLRKHLK